jgi:ATP-dependent Lon protease
MGKIKETIVLPVIPLRGLTIFPNSVIHFDVKREETLKAIDTAMNDDKRVFLVTQRDSGTEYPLESLHLYKVGVIATIKQVVKLPGKSSNKLTRVICQGDLRANLDMADDVDGFLQGEMTLIEDEDFEIDTEMEALIRTAHDTVLEFSKVFPKFSREAVKKLNNTFEPSLLADSIGTNLVMPTENRQSLLSKNNVRDRLKTSIMIINGEIEIGIIRNDIQMQVKRKIDKNQKDYYLREQVKAIQNELGEGASAEEEIDEYSEKAESIKAPEKVKDRLKKEVDMKIENKPSKREMFFGAFEK